MMPVLHLSRRLLDRPTAPLRSPAGIRTWIGDTDIPNWLALHRICFPAPRPELRQWEEADLRRDMISKGGWRPEWTWFAEVEDALAPIGMISLLTRPSDPPARIHIHWLAVAPGWRHGGIGRQLLVTSEQAAWDAGYRELVLETLAAWKEAVAFYEACGYR